jgi:YD repeat-containing protein
MNQGKYNTALKKLMGTTYTLSIVSAVSVFTTSASASETSTYKYDALGRLVQTTTTGGPSSGTNTAVVYDKAGNRSNYNVTGSPNTIPVTGARVIVVPLNGFTVIPIN